MTLRCDAHIHIYPQQDAASTLQTALWHLTNAASPADRFALFLTESKACNWFAQLKDGSHGLPDNFTVTPTAEAEAMNVAWGGQSLTVFAGRQIVTAERLEILALTLADIPADGEPAEAVLKDIQARGAVPVLSWAPGKWMFARAKTVKNLIAQHQGPLLLGDSSLRCQGWPMPAPMREARFPLLAGSDPLPVPGEETQAGTYGVEIDMDLDPDRPVTAIRQALLNPDTSSRFLGNRSSAFTMLSRLYRHRQHKKSASGQ